MGKDLSNYEKVNKILRCLPSSFDAKITAITESKDLNSYSIDSLLGSLIAYEQGVNQRNLDAGERKKEKTVALKTNDTESETSGSDSDDVALITRQFKSFLRRSKGIIIRDIKVNPVRILKVHLTWFVLNAGNPGM